MQVPERKTVETKQRGGLIDAAYMRLPAKYRRVLGEMYGLELDGEAASVPLPEGDIARRAMLAAALGRLRAVAQRVD